MRLLVAAVFAVLGAMGAGSAMAQNAQPLCHHAGLTYSPGSMMRMGRVLAQCAVDENSVGTWVALADDTANTSANCMSAGREFGQGSEQLSNGVVLKCSAGVWYEKSQ